ncbi:MAG TPA: hypothetical protein VKA51_04225 [Rubrobacteraceae bacterium]|nr:hypothetical protein [Rubrobacteraceae bacterium]
MSATGGGGGSAPFRDVPDDPFELAWGWYRPPEFPALRDTPRVSGWCRTHWLAFREEWSRENELFVLRIMAALDRVRVDRLVREWEDGTERTAGLFVLSVYFVRGLDKYHRESYLDRLVLGEAYLEPRNAPLLRSALKAQISRLA